jgi:hypothetical protein
MLIQVMKRMSAALALVALAVSAPALGATPGGNQATADAVAATLSTVPNLAGSPVQIEARGGVVTLSGQVASPELKAAAVGMAQRVAGVSAVVDRLQITPDPLVQAARYNTGFGHNAAMAGQPVMGGMGMEGAMAGAPMAGGFAADGSPLPEGPAIPGASNMGQPASPNYAWPSYAPYPNFSAVGYPTVYPWQAWPNIGPFYPYPEVPLDWRAVTLRWDDGLWWLDFKKHYTRPFFTPYPFGLWAY